ncbi:MAG: CPBP family intramembrane metalloprotease [Candidatus Moranbacteria bacterium]|nr:CPBP family intramembrane metalloprotease [Candidatus Moranbacteria bacterium]
MLETLSKNRRFVVTGLLVVFSILFLGFFPENDRLSPAFQGLIVSLAFFLVIPLLYSKIVLRESLKNIGLQKGNFGAGVLIGTASVILAVILVVFLAFTFPPFRAQYVFPALIETGFVWFVLYELVLVPFMIILYEVFFRGLVELLWLKAFGLWAVFIQTGIFLGFSYLSHDVSWQRLPFLIFCPLAGFIAYRSGSLWYSFAASWVFLFLTDIFFLVFR